jgi:hypothetical protein
MKRLKSKLLLVCVLTLLFGMAELAVGAPANDNCANATSVGNVTDLAFDTTLATFDGPGHCTTGPNIWYVYTATQSGGLTISLCGSSYDTTLAVYDGSNCPPKLEDMIRCNDDFCGRQSEVEFAVTAGNQYLIEIGGFGSNAGQGVMTISHEMFSNGTPSNDDRHDAGYIDETTERTFDTTYATFDGPGLCMEGPNIWYIFAADFTGNVTISLCGSSYDTKLALYDSSGWYPDSDDLIECNDDFCGTDAQITFMAVAGNHYLIEVGGFEDETGQGVLNISTGWGPGEPTNDDCYNATAVGNVTNLPFDTTHASPDGPGYYNTSDNIWYRYTAPYTCDVTVDLCSSSFDTVIVVYDGWDCTPAFTDIIARDDDSCGSYGLRSKVTFAAIASHHYLIEIGGATGSDWGPGVLTISCEGWPPSPPPWSNDDCDNAKPIGNVTNLPFDTTDATFDGPGVCIDSPNIWYRYTATGTGDVTVSLCGSSYDTKLAVYRGGNCPSSQSDLIECNDDFCGWQSEITFAAIAGRQYLIEVGGFGSETGQGVISVSFEGGEPPEPPTKALDLGDAPDSTNNFSAIMAAYPKGGPLGVRASYPTVFNDGSGTGPYGPVHLYPLAVAHLGSTITNEAEADIGIDQDAVNNIIPLANLSDLDQGDDGVIFPLNMPHCRWTTFDYFVNVINPGTGLWVNVWCDWNRDGDWDDDSSTDSTLNCPKGPVSEWAVQNQYLFGLSTGLHQITTPAFLSCHPKNTPEEIWMRITLSERPWTGGSNPGTKGNGGSGPQTGYEYGETEDYYFTPKTSYTACEDFNGDGVINLADLATFTADWLENCPQ